MILSVALISISLFNIEELVVQLEKPSSILHMQGFCNKIYDNAHEIIGWDTMKVKKNLDKGGNGNGRCECCWYWGRDNVRGWGEYGSGYVVTYTHLLLGGSNISHNNIQQNRVVPTQDEKK